MFEDLKGRTAAVFGVANHTVNATIAVTDSITSGV